MNNGKLFFLLISAALLGGMLSFGLVKLFSEPTMQIDKTIKIPVSKNIPRLSKDAFELQTDFSNAINKAMPAVVLITSQKRVGVMSPYGNIFDYGKRKIDYMDVPSGQGSGFFIRNNGYILTNYHVVRAQDSFWITTHDGKEYPAKVVGSDPPTDLAVLRIETSGKEFPALAFADQETLELGHWAIAIGAPYSLNRSVTLGIVSNKKRGGVGVNLHESYVQTDASINPGNSGGPLLNLNGDVIGVNDFILSPTGGSIGLSFAISSDIAEKISDELIEKGHVERPWLGIVMDTLSREERKKLGISNGVRVAQIFRNSPAAGQLLRGDIILSANGNVVNLPHDLQNCIFSLTPNSKLSLEILRSGKQINLELTIRKSPGNWFSRNENSNQGSMLVSEGYLPL